MEIGNSHFGTVNNDLTGEQIFRVLGEMAFKEVLFIVMEVVLNTYLDKRGYGLGADTGFGALLHVFVEDRGCQRIAFIVN